MNKMETIANIRSLASSRKSKSPFSYLNTGFSDDKEIAEMINRSVPVRMSKVNT